MQKDLSHLISLTTGKLFRIPLAVFSASLLARAVGPDGVGQWAMILAVTHLFHSFLFGWTQSGNVRFGREEWTLQNRLSDTWSTRLPLIITGLGLATILLIIQPFSFLEHFFNLSSSWWPFLLFFILGQWWLSESQSLYRINGKIGSLTLIPILMELATIFFLATLFLQPHENRIDLGLSGMILVATVISGIAWMKEFYSSRSWGGKSNMEKRKKFIKYSWPLIPGIVFAYLSNWGDHILLQYFKSVKEVGFFSISYQVLQALMGLATSISIIFLPKLIDRNLSNPGIEQDYLQRIGPTIISLWLMILIPALVFLPGIFYIVFGNYFLEAIPILLILCATVPGSIFTAIYAILFETQERLAKVAYLNAIKLLLNFIISFVLVVKFGGIGVAIGTAVSYFLVQFLYVLDQHKFLDIPIKRTLILLLFCILYGILQCVVGNDFLLRLGIALSSFACLIPIIRHYSMVDKAILTKLFPKNFPGHNFIIRLMIQNNNSPD